VNQALNRTLAQLKKYRHELLRREYVLDETRNRHRMLTLMDIHESKERIAPFRILMPLDSEKEADMRLSELIEEGRRCSPEIDAVLVEFSPQSTARL